MSKLLSEEIALLSEQFVDMPQYNPAIVESAAKITKEWSTRAAALEAEVGRYREALERIRDFDPPEESPSDDTIPIEHVTEIARAALATTPETTSEAAAVATEKSLGDVTDPAESRTAAASGAVPGEPARCVCGWLKSAHDSPPTDDNDHCDEYEEGPAVRIPPQKQHKVIKVPAEPPGVPGGEPTPFYSFDGIVREDCGALIGEPETTCDSDWLAGLEGKRVRLTVEVFDLEVLPTGPEKGEGR